MENQRRTPEEEIQELVRELEVDLMVLNVQSNSGMSQRLERAVQLLRAIGPDQLSQLGQMRKAVEPIVRGDLIVVPPIAVSWVIDHAKSRMREALGGARDFRSLLKDILTQEAL